MFKFYDTIIINDAGEEVDDECAIKKAFSGTYFNKSIAYVCVGGKLNSEERIKRVKSLIPEIEDIYSIEDFYFMRRNDNMKIIQIGPINYCYMDKVKYIVKTAGLYDYVLQGKLGMTVNSKEDSKVAAEYLFENSRSVEIVDGPYPKFNYSNSKYFGKKIKEEIIKLGFKNTLGRAPALPFTVHLVGKGGANYESVNSFYKAITNMDLKNVIPNEICLDNASKYIEKVNYDNPFTISKMIEFNQTKYSQKMGLAQMLAVFEEVFGINYVIYSSDNIFDNPEDMMSYHVYNDIMKKNIYTDMTPAYDLKALHVAMTGDKNCNVEDIMLHNDYYILAYNIAVFILVVIFFKMIVNIC